MRYLPLTDADRAEMLSVVGAPDIDALFRDVPRSARLDGPVDLPAHAGELEVERALAKLQDGRYGVSEKSGAPIPYARLAAVPWARTAVGE